MRIASYDQLRQLPAYERTSILSSLGVLFTQRVQAAADRGAMVEAIVSELRQAGYDLYMFDSDGDWQTWCCDWTRSDSINPLIVEFDADGDVTLSWRSPADSSSAQTSLN